MILRLLAFPGGNSLLTSARERIRAILSRTKTGAQRPDCRGYGRDFSVAV